MEKVNGVQKVNRNSFYVKIKDLQKTVIELQYDIGCKDLFDSSMRSYGAEVHYHIFNFGKHISIL